MESKNCLEGVTAAGRRTLPTDPQAAQRQKVARDFEALFIGMMLKSMRETTHGESLTGGGQAEETYRSMLDQEYSQTLSQQGGIGLAHLIEQQLATQHGNSGAGVAGIKGDEK
ncbi:MAG TPA: rod-binding protein [Geobacterales bacterium]|nr:rod-binding protein [Geobacterales bacterium]